MSNLRGQLTLQKGYKQKGRDSLLVGGSEESVAISKTKEKDIHLSSIDSVQSSLPGPPGRN